MYALLPKNDWDHATEIYDHGGAIFVHTSAIDDRVDGLTGRTNVLRIPSIARKLREGKRVYIQGNRARGELSLLVQRVPLRK